MGDTGQKHEVEVGEGCLYKSQQGTAVRGVLEPESEAGGERVGEIPVPSCGAVDVREERDVGVTCSRCATSVPGRRPSYPGDREERGSEEDA